MQNSFSPISNTKIARRYLITGSRRLSNFFWAFLISFGGAGFLTTGFFSFLNRVTSFAKDDSVLLEGDAVRSPLGKATGAALSHFPLSSLTNNSISFFPQGLTMCFYGSLGLIFGIYLWLTIFWKVGSGFNEFNKESGVVRIFRWGLPGKNRQIDFTYKIKDIEALRLSLKEGINPRRSIALQIKGKGEIPLTRIGQPISLQDIENQASELAAFLKVEIKVEN